MMTEKIARSKRTQTMLKTVPQRWAWPAATRTVPTTTASTRAAMAYSWGLTRCHAGPVGSWRVLGVTAKSRLRPRKTLPKAEVKDLIKAGKRDREYCWQRQVGRQSA